MSTYKHIIELRKEGIYLILFNFFEKMEIPIENLLRSTKPLQKHTSLLPIVNQIGKGDIASRIAQWLSTDTDHKILYIIHLCSKNDLIPINYFQVSKNV